ncbi:MAG: electron transfer flavoprotein subunit beta/FixA family protein [Bdellovibrionaceae bacterium]|nr:electron transfer flavoprotein subunit beta/FixA family protein [Pseudobdellovibrionaceae bacterium]
MKVFVCVKQVPDTETKIKIRADGNGIDTIGIKWVMNPYDEIAVEEAIKMREGGKATHVTAIGLGPKARVSETLRTALAMGADDAIVIDAPEDVDSFSTAKALAAAIRAEGEYKFVLTGKLAIDDNQSSVSQMVAEFLGIPHTTVVSKLEYADNQVTAEREVEGGSREVVQLSLPAVVAANKGLNSPRYASLPGIMKAKKKVIKELALGSLDTGEGDIRVRFQNFQLPPEKPAAQIIPGDVATATATLVRLLREEAKVI